MKTCDDCGGSSPDGAVTCVECGSLFVDQVGVDLRRWPASGEDAERPRPADVTELTASGAVARALSRCRQCGATGLASQRRCTVCGSTQLSVQLAGSGPSASGAMKGSGSSAWERRPNVGIFDDPKAQIDTEFAYVYLAIGLFKMLLCSMLGGTLLLEEEGPGGLQFMTFEWRYPLAALLFADALLAALGGFGLVRARRIGAWMLAVSFVLDVLLVTWLILGLVTGNLVVWPGTGPYTILALVCLYGVYDAILRAGGSSEQS